MTLYTVCVAHLRRESTTAVVMKHERHGKTIPANSESSPTRARIEPKSLSGEANFS